MKVQIAAAAATVIALLGLWVVPSAALSCACGGSPCDNPVCCPSGTELVGDACGCCKVCAKTLDESCGGPWRVGGVCGSGLSCLRQCECKTVSGRECVFPFKYKGKSFDQCTTEGSENGSAWCAFTLDPTGEVVEGQWGDCQDGCPGTSYTCGDSEIFNMNGRCVDTSRAEIEANKRLNYSLDEGALSPDIVPQCQSSPGKLDCSCAPVDYSSAQKGEGCKVGGRGLPGWCFLTNVADPSDPTKGCYEDTTWSATNGRFWSALACQTIVSDGGNYDDFKLIQNDESKDGSIFVEPTSPPPPSE